MFDKLRDFTNKFSVALESLSNYFVNLLVASWTPTNCDKRVGAVDVSIVTFSFLMIFFYVQFLALTCALSPTTGVSWK